MALIISEKQCFFPDGFEYATPSQFDLEFETFEIQGEDGLMLTGWHILPQRDVPGKGKTILHLHGNAQNMSAHLFGSYFLAREGFRLVTFDYRGYGRSQGNPTLSGIIADGRAILDHLFETRPFKDEPLVLFGQSMGAFTGAHLLPHYPGLDRAVLEAGLISFRRLFVEAYPEAEVRIPEGFSTLAPLARSGIPKLFIHGTNDGVVPLSHSEEMYRAAAPPKDLLVLPGVGHVDALASAQSGSYRQGILAFLSNDPR